MTNKAPAIVGVLFCCQCVFIHTFHLTPLFLVCINTHMTSKEVIKQLEKAGWVKLGKRGKGSHTVMYHPQKPGKVTIPKGEIKTGTLASIRRTTGEHLK